MIGSIILILISWSFVSLIIGLVYKQKEPNRLEKIIYLIIVAPWIIPAFIFVKYQEKNYEKIQRKRGKHSYGYRK